MCLLLGYLLSRLSCCQRCLSKMLLSLCFFLIESVLCTVILACAASYPLSPHPDTGGQFLSFLVCSPPASLVWWLYFPDLETFPLSLPVHFQYVSCHFLFLSGFLVMRQHVECWRMLLRQPAPHGRDSVFTPPGILWSCAQKVFGVLHHVSCSVITDSFTYCHQSCFNLEINKNLLFLVVKLGGSQNWQVMMALVNKLGYPDLTQHIMSSIQFFLPNPNLTQAHNVLSPVFLTRGNLPYFFKNIKVIS